MVRVALDTNVAIDILNENVVTVRKIDLTDYTCLPIYGLWRIAFWCEKFR